MAGFSLTAIEKLLPHLERGLPLSSRDGGPSALQAAGYLRPGGPSVSFRRDLPPPPAVTNPLVRAALYELRKVVNALLREYGPPRTIRLCLAREVKGTAEVRHRTRQALRDLARRRAAAVKQISQLGAQVTRDHIERYLLWEEQGQVCFYSYPDRTITLAELFGGDVVIDHLLPFAHSLDDSLSNKVLCLRGQQRVKGEQTPCAWLAEAAPQKYAALLERTARLPPGVRHRKRAKCGPRPVARDESISRQLADPAYMTRQVADYLHCLGAAVVCPTGQLTAQLRRRWELGAVLSDRGLGLTPREDFRQHALQAIIVALTSRSRLAQLAQAGNSEEYLPPPWGGFRVAAAGSKKPGNSCHANRSPRRRSQWSNRSGTPK